MQDMIKIITVIWGYALGRNLLENVTFHFILCRTEFQCETLSDSPFNATTGSVRSSLPAHPVVCGPLE